MKQFWVIGLLLLTGCIPAKASLWYCDVNAVGANNGTSWANAWTSIQAISSSVKPGDTVFISGGPTGTTNTYNLVKLNPWSGAGQLIVHYRIGQDSLHNGYYLFHCTTAGAQNLFMSKCNNFELSGDAGDGNMHFHLDDSWQYVADLSGDQNVNVNFLYCGGPLLNGFDYNSQGVTHLIVHNCWVMQGGSATVNDDHIFNIGFKQARTWDQSFFYSNTLYAPSEPSTGNQGSDFFQIGGDGVTWFYNSFYEYPTNNYLPGNNQHQDGIQWTGPNYKMKVFCNTFVNIQNYSIFMDPYWGITSDMWFYNNIFIGCGGPTCGTDGGYSQAPSTAPLPNIFSNVVIANNLIDKNQAGYNAGSLNNGTSHSTLFISNIIANNIYINCNACATNGNSTTFSWSNLVVTSASGWTTNLQNYISPENTNNNYNWNLVNAQAHFSFTVTNLTYIFTNDYTSTTLPATNMATTWCTRFYDITNWEPGPYAIDYECPVIPVPTAPTIPAEQQSPGSMAVF